MPANTLQLLRPKATDNLLSKASTSNNQCRTNSIPLKAVTRHSKATASRHHLINMAHLRDNMAVLRHRDSTVHRRHSKVSMERLRLKASTGHRRPRDSMVPLRHRDSTVHHHHKATTALPHHRAITAPLLHNNNKDSMARLKDSMELRHKDSTMHHHKVEALAASPLRLRSDTALKRPSTLT